MSDSRVIFEKSIKGRMGIAIPKLDVPEVSLSDSIPPELLREIPANLPEVSEPQVVRHYVNLSVKNHHVDKDLYPFDKIGINPYILTGYRLNFNTSAKVLKS